MFFRPPIQQLYSLIERIRTGSILAPLLALTFIVGIFVVLTTWISHDIWLVERLWGLFALCVAAVLVAYIIWAVKEPDRLQTEDYRLARHRIDVIGDERNPNDPKLIEATPTANPHLPLPETEAAK